MKVLADRPQAPSAIHTDLRAIFVPMELSRSIWLITSVSPGGGEKMSKHAVGAGNIAGLLEWLAQLKEKAVIRESAARFVSDVALRFRPDVFHRQSQAAFDPDRLMRFIGHGIGALDPAGELDRTEQRQVLFARATDLDHHTSVVTARPPHRVVVVTADGRRQAQL